MAEEWIPANWELRWCPRSLRKAVAFGPTLLVSMAIGITKS